MEDLTLMRTNLTTERTEEAPRTLRNKKIISVISKSVSICDIFFTADVEGLRRLR